MSRVIGFLFGLATLCIFALTFLVMWGLVWKFGQFAARFFGWE